MAQQYGKSQQSSKRKPMQRSGIPTKAQQRQTREFTLNSLRKNKRQLEFSNRRGNAIDAATKSCEVLNELVPDRPLDGILFGNTPDIIAGLEHHSRILTQVLSSENGMDNFKADSRDKFAVLFNSLLFNYCLSNAIVDKIVMLTTRYDNIDIQKAAMQALANIIQLVRDWKHLNTPCDTSSEKVLRNLLDYLMKHYVKLILVMDHVLSFLRNDDIFIGGPEMTSRLLALQCVGNLFQLYILYYPPSDSEGATGNISTNLIFNMSEKIFKTSLTWISNLSSDLAIMPNSIFKNRSEYISSTLLEIGLFLSGMAPCVFCTPSARHLVNESVHEHDFVACLLMHMNIVAVIKTGKDDGYREISILWNILSNVLEKITEKTLALFPTSAKSKTNKPITKVFIVDQVIKNSKIMESLITLLRDPNCEHHTIFSNLYICGEIIAISQKHSEILLSRTPFIRILINLFTRDMEYLNALVQPDNVPMSMYDESQAKSQFLPDTISRLKLMLWIISNIAAGTFPQITQLFEVNIITLVVNILKLFTISSINSHGNQKSSFEAQNLLNYTLLTIRHIVTEGSPHFIYELVEFYHIIPHIVRVIDYYKTNLEITSYGMCILSVCLAAGITVPHTSDTDALKNKCISRDGFRLCGVTPNDTGEIFEIELGWNYGKELSFAGGVELVEEMLDHTENMVFYYAQEISDVLENTYKITVTGEPESLVEDTNANLINSDFFWFEDNNSSSSSNISYNNNISNSNTRDNIATTLHMWYDNMSDGNL